MTQQQVATAQYFKTNTALVAAGPAQINEHAEARKRQQVYQQAVNEIRELKDALVISRQLDKSGNFDAALDHVLVVWDRVKPAMEQVQRTGTMFLAAFDAEDAA